MKFSTRPNPRASFRTGALALSAAALLVVAGCESSTDLDDDHSDLGRVELQTRGAASAIIGVWTPTAGWTDANGNAITQITTPRDVEGAGLQPLVAGGGNASLTVRYFLPGGAPINMGTLDRGPEPARARSCTEDEARYAPTNNNTNVIAWPNIRHPAAPTGPFHFVQLPNGSTPGIFHCDHVHIYPLQAGNVDLEFLLWHDDHADGNTDPIRFVVQPAN